MLHRACEKSDCEPALPVEGAGRLFPDLASLWVGCGATLTESATGRIRHRIRGFFVAQERSGE